LVSGTSDGTGRAQNPVDCEAAAQSGKHAAMNVRRIARPLFFPVRPHIDRLAAAIALHRMRGTKLATVVSAR
jgi:hypothetical protein